jgi:hypothetical protein
MHPPGAHRVGDVAHLLLPQVFEAGPVLAPLDRRADRLRHGDAARVSQALQPGGDVHAVAVDRAIGLFDHIAQVNADAKAHAAVFRDTLDQFGQLFLHRQGCRDGAAGSLEDGQHGIAGHVDDPALVCVDQPAEYRARSIEPGDRGLVVDSHQPGEAGRVGRKNGRQAMFESGRVHCSNAGLVHLWGSDPKAV